MIFKAQIRNKSSIECDSTQCKFDVEEAISYFNNEYDESVMKFIECTNSYFIFEINGKKDNGRIFKPQDFKELTSYLYNDKNWCSYSSNTSDLLKYTDVTDVFAFSNLVDKRINSFENYSLRTDYKIKEVKIERYKGINQINFNLSDVNLLIGGNNSSKSSLLQAIHLGISCMQTHRKYYGQVKNKLKLSNGKVYTTVTYDELIYKPIENFRKLGHKKDLGRSESENDIRISYKSNLDQEVNVFIESGKARGNTLGLRPSGDLEYYNYLANEENNVSYYVTGLSGIPGREEKRSVAIVKEMAVKGASNNVFRNIILLLYKHENQNKWKELHNYISEIFENLQLEVDFEEKEHMDINVYAVLGNNKYPIDSMGTSVLQLIQMIGYILLYDPRVIIIDEPDAHLQPSNQKKIMDLLLKINKDKNTQLIISTHSKYIVEHLYKDSNIIWLEEGKCIEHTENEKSWISLMSDIGALEKGAKISGKFVKCCILTEDKDISYLENLLKSNGFSIEETDIWSYKGCTKIDVARAIAGYLEERFEGIEIIVHIDKDYIPDNEMKKIVDKFKNDSKIHLFITRENDIESYFVDSNHINSLYQQISLQDAKALIDSTVNEMFDDTIKYISQQVTEFCLKNNLKNEIGEYIGKALLLHRSNPRLYTKGKDLLSLISGKIQYIIKTNVNLNRESTYLYDEMLSKIAMKIWD